MATAQGRFTCLARGFLRLPCVFLLHPADLFFRQPVVGIDLSFPPLVVTLSVLLLDEHELLELARVRAVLGLGRPGARSVEQVNRHHQRIVAVGLILTGEFEFPSSGLRGHAALLDLEPFQSH